MAGTADFVGGPNILVPLDASDLAEKALDFSAALARRSGGRLTLVTVPLLYHLDLSALHPYPGGRSAPDYIAPPDELIRASVAEAEQYLQLTAARLTREGLKVDARVVSAMPADAILDQAESGAADLIVMATHGRGGVSRWAMGSVTDKVLQAAPCPIIVLRGGRQRDPIALSKILVPLDGSALAEACLLRLLPLAKAFEAQLALVQVIVPLETLPIEIVGAMLAGEELYREEVAGYLETQAERLRSEGLDVSTEVLLGDSVAETLLERSARDDCDMIALSTHGRGGLRRWAFGSVADRLVRQADTPVFVVREANPPVDAG